MTRKLARATLAACAPLALAMIGCNIYSIDSTSSSSSGAGGALPDGGAGGGIPDGGTPDSGAGSRCTETPMKATCPYQEQSIPAEGGVLRSVDWQTPLGTPPAKGWPAVLLFQGSFFAPPLMFDGTAGAPFGVYHLARTIKGLLDAGYTVIAPFAHANGSSFWDTNVPPWSTNWQGAPDNAFMLSIFASINAGKFGPVDASRLYATGISSGGYMTSRMAVSYPGQFKALAVHSGSYATCSGPVCAVPDPLPADHPPTLFLHGGADAVVPVGTMQSYNARLVSEGKETRVVVDPPAGHEWIAAGPKEVVAWFNAHP